VVALEAVPRLPRLGLVLLLVGFLPALALGALGPALARLAIDRPGATGRQSGRLFAANALGSLAGAALAGLVLVPSLGVRGTALLVAAALALPIAAWGGLGQTTRRLGPPLLLVAAAAWAAPHACDDESAYQCVRVAEEAAPDRAEGTVRVLYLDGLPHAHVDLDDPLHLVHDYLVPAAELAHYQQRPGAAGPRVLVIGGGGYSLPRYLAAALGDPPIDVLELDPAVTEMARRRLGLGLRPPFAIHHGDARQTLADLPPAARYDLAVLDAFSDVVVPFHLVTDRFDRAVRDRLAPDGVYAALVHDRGDVGRLLPAAARTVGTVFGAVDVLAAGPGVGWRSARPRTWTVVGSREGLDGERLRAVRRPTRAGPFPPLSERMPSDELGRLLARPGPAVLSDDHAPVEVLAAPLFR
jgi:spermidine synthase